MKTIVKSPGSATIINAISTGFGSAFGIKLYVTAKVELKGSDSSSVICSADKDVDTHLWKHASEWWLKGSKNIII